jgi:hypothetical protein
MRTSLENIPAIIQNRKPLKFGCKECNQPIIVKYLHYGEKAKCGNCGLLNIVPETAVETSEQPDYTKLRQMAESRDAQTTSKRKLFSQKRVFHSGVISFVLITIIESITHDTNQIRHFIFIFTFSYLIEYFGAQLKNNRPLRRGNATGTHTCSVCSAAINRGELYYYDYAFKRLKKTYTYLCVKCYQEIFYSPEALSAARKEQVKPKGKFKLFPG